jgi:hypothetical protein
MSWKLIFGLSLFGLATGLATIFAFPQAIEPHVWLGVFGLSAIVIAKRAPGKYFLHGLCVSLVNSLWLTAAHVALFDNYVAVHARVVAMAARVGSPHIMMMAIGGPVAGIALGVLLGFCAWLGSKFLVSSHSEFAGW